MQQKIKLFLLTLYMIIITKYEKFMESKASDFDYGCVMIDLNVSNWKDILSEIDPKDIYPGKTYGLQDNPHITFLYGLHPEVTFDQVQKCFDDVKGGDIKIEVEGVSIFENPEFDVVKLGVKENPILSDINQNLSKLPNSNEFKEFIPHITVGYVNKGCGKKYINPNFRHTINGVKNVKYSKPNGDEHNIIIKEKFHFSI